MIIVTSMVFKGLTHKSYWYIYHDELTIFSSITSLQYMEEKGFKEHLILPQLSYNDQTNGANRMVGTYPDLMSMDTHLNQDTHESVDHYCNWTSHLHDSDLRKFSKHIPNKSRMAYKRVWDPKLGQEERASLGKKNKRVIECIID